MENTQTHSNFELVLRKDKLAKEQHIDYLTDKNAIKYWTTLSSFFKLTRIFTFTK